MLITFSGYSLTAAWVIGFQLAWRIPGTEEPGGLPSMGSHRVDTTKAT